MQVRHRVSSRFLHVLVDEFQDTNAVQCMVAAAAASVHGNLMVVGDSQQSIYSWRQAERGNLRHLLDAMGEGRLVHLKRNYRSTGRVLACANSTLAAEVVLQAEGGAPADPHATPHAALWTRNAEGPSAQFHVYESEEDEAEGVAWHIRGMVGGKGEREEATIEGLRECLGEVRLSDVAVLCRTAAQLKKIEAALQHAGVPCRGQQGTRPSAATKPALAHLSLLLETERGLPPSAASLGAAARSVGSLGEKSVASLLREAAEQGRAPLQLAAQLARGASFTGFRPSAKQLASLRQLSELHERLHHSLASGAGIAALLEIAIDATAPRSIQDAEASRQRMEAIDTLRQCAADCDAKYAQRTQAEASRDGPDGIGTDRGGARGDGARGVAEDDISIAESAVALLESFLLDQALGWGRDAEGGCGVTLSTVHRLAECNSILMLTTDY